LARLIPHSREAYRLLHEGAQALAEVEANGIRIDADYLAKAIRRTEERIERLRNKLMESEVGREWRRLYGSRVNLNSDIQLASVLFDAMGFESSGRTKSGRFKTDVKTLEQVDHPFVRDYLKLRSLQKTLSTNLQGLEREVMDGYVHPMFSLHTTRTYRSSSEAINFQNIPTRDQRTRRLVRRVFVARKDRRLVEVDYSGIEVRIAACYHKDPRMIEYIQDPTKDMHRDMAAECFLLPQREITPQIRHLGKNKFVFPEFYGDWYIDCAAALWRASSGLKTASGTPLRYHLAQQGIRKLGVLDSKKPPRPNTFEAHIQKVERRFWGELFPDYAQWKKDWYEHYRRRGWFRMLTGFVCRGHMERRKVISYPIQGAAFHCLLWSLIRLVRELKKRKLRSVIVGQIHDSIVADVVSEEFGEYLDLARRVMTKDLVKAWDWICVPLEVGIEASPVGGSWADMEKVKI